MKISYCAKKHGGYKSIKLLTIRFKHILEKIQFELSDRGYLLWVITPKTIRVFGFWKKDGGYGSRKLYQHWENDHCCCAC